MPFNVCFDIYATDEHGVRKLDMLNPSKPTGRSGLPASYRFAGDLTPQISETFLGFVLNELISTLNKDYEVVFPLLGKCEECGRWVDNRHLGYPQEPVYSEDGELLYLREKTVCFECLR